MSTTVFLTGYFLLSQSIAAKDREVVRAQLDVYRAWYQDGGLGELSEHFSQRDDSGKESFFVRVTGNESNGLFISLPRQSAQFDLTTLDKINLAKPLTWLTLPSQDQSTNWLIATTLLPDGDRLEVGKTTEAQTALLKHFQFVFGSAVVIAIVLGLAGGSLLAHLRWPRSGNSLRDFNRLLRRENSTNVYPSAWPTTNSRNSRPYLTSCWKRMPD